MIDREKGLKSMAEANCSLQQKELEIKKLQSKWLTDIQQQVISHHLLTKI